MNGRRRLTRVRTAIILCAVACFGTFASSSARAQVRVQVCKKCLPSTSDTSSTTGVVSVSPGFSHSFQTPPMAFVGRDHGLRYARPTSGGWLIEPVDSTTIASGISLGFDTGGTAMISYRDGNGILNWAQRMATSWSFEVVETTGGVGGATSIANLASGVGIAYHDSVAGLLKYAERSSGGVWSITTVTGSESSNGRYASLVADGSARAISYYDETHGDLRIAVNSGASWTTSLVDGVGNVGGFSSLIGGPSLGGFGIAYYDFGNGDLKYAYQAGATWVVQTVDAAGDVGRHCTAVALGATASDAIEISYYDRTNGALKRARKQSSTWSISVQDNFGNVGGFASSLTSAGPADSVGTAYADMMAGDLYYRWRADGVTAVADTQASPLAPRWLRNPGGAGGRVRFTVPRAGPVRVSVYDTNGRRIATPLRGHLAAGPAEVRWDAADSGGAKVAAGVFLVQIETSGGRAAVPAIILRGLPGSDPATFLRRPRGGRVASPAHPMSPRRAVSRSRRRGTRLRPGSFQSFVLIEREMPCASTCCETTSCSLPSCCRSRDRPPPPSRGRTVPPKIAPSASTTTPSAM